nr:MAG TPA: hypothetical protein [Caudoviricetes sp.]
MGKLTHPNYTISPRKMQTLPASRTGLKMLLIRVTKRKALLLLFFYRKTEVKRP